MSSPPFLYTCIAHNTTVLSEYTPFPSSNPSSTQTAQLATIILPKIPHDQPQKLTYTYGEQHIHYIATSKAANALTFLLITDKSVQRKTAFGFLTKIQEEFGAKYTPSSIAGAPSYGFAEFNKELQVQMEVYEKGGFDDEGSRNVRAVQEEIESVRGIMTQNIERVLERGERIDLLVDKTDRLGEGARGFRVGARRLRRRMWWKNVKLMILLTVVVIFLVYLFVGFGCGLPGWQKCIGSSKNKTEN